MYINNSIDSSVMMMYFIYKIRLKTAITAPVEQKS